MKAVLFVILLALPLAADDWKDKLSPRMRESFKDMTREDWKPQKAATLSEKEKAELRNLGESLQKVPVARPAPAPAPAPQPEGK